MSRDRNDDDYDDEDDYEDEARPRRRRRRDDYEVEHRGGLILALGIISLVACWPVGIAAWIMGSSDLKAMEEGIMDSEGRSMTQTGKILGIVACAIICLLILFYAVIFVVAIGAGAAGAGGR